MQKTRIMNAAGECKYPDQVKDLARSAVTDIRVGAITFQEEERLGNREQNPNGNFFWIDEETGNALNALGLPNPGRRYYAEHLPEMVRIAMRAGKRLGVNISGTGESDEEYPILAELCATSSVHTIEVNVGCPNVWSGGKRKPIASYDPEAVAAILQSVQDALPKKSPVEVDVKLSPLIVLPSEPFRYSPQMVLPPLDEGLIGEVAAVIVEAGFVNAVVSTNTVPGVFALDESGNQVLSTPGGLGGLSGPIIKALSLRQNLLLEEKLAEHIKRYSVGGIGNGRDMFDFVNAAWVDGIQIGTAWMRFGTRIFGDIFQEYVELTEEEPASA